MKKSFLLLLLFFAGACSLIPGPRTQKIHFDTVPESGATCTISGKDDTWRISTPDTIKVDRDSGDLKVSCEKTGYGKETTVVKSSLSSDYSDEEENSTGFRTLLFTMTAAVHSFSQGSYPRNVTLELHKIEN